MDFTLRTNASSSEPVQEAQAATSNPSPILHLLPPPLLHLPPPISRRTPIRDPLFPTLSRKPSHTVSHAPKSSVRQPRPIDRYHSPQPPRLVPQKRRSNNTPPCPVEHVPQKLRQALSVEVLARAHEFAIRAAGGAADALEPVFDGEGGEGEEGVEEEGGAGGGGAEDEEAEEEEEEVCGEGEGVRAVEDGGVAGGELFGCFLRGVSLMLR